MFLCFVHWLMEICSLRFWLRCGERDLPGLRVFHGVQRLFPTALHFCRLLPLPSPGLPINAVLTRGNFELVSLSDGSAVSSLVIHGNTDKYYLREL